MCLLFNDGENRINTEKGHTILGASSKDPKAKTNQIIIFMDIFVLLCFICINNISWTKVFVKSEYKAAIETDLR